jgi:hypothetical protein
MVVAYYRVSPPIADSIRHHPIMRWGVRQVLLPIVWWVRLVLASPGLGLALAGGLLFLAALGLLLAVRLGGTHGRQTRH